MENSQRTMSARKRTRPGVSAEPLVPFSIGHEEERFLPENSASPEIEQTPVKGDSSFAFRQFLKFARRSGVAQSYECSSIFGLLAAGRAVGDRLLRLLKPLGLDEVGFLSLVALYSLDPAPVSSADLAYHSGGDLNSVVGALEFMEEKSWIQLKRLSSNGSTLFASLTDEGRMVAVFVLYRFLRAVSHLSDGISPSRQRSFTTLCRKLRQFARTEAL
jgi:DNA-binding MarR family transcriptional regulator